MTETERNILKRLDEQKLADAIELVKGIDRIEWGGGGPTGEKTAQGEDILQWPYPIYPEGLFETLYLLGTDRNYLENMKALKTLDVSTLNLKQLRTFLTFISRGERFTDGFLQKYVENGQLLKALERIEEICETCKNKTGHI